MLYRLFLFLVGYYRITLKEGLKASNRYLKGRLAVSFFSRLPSSEGKGAVCYCPCYRKALLQKRFLHEGLTAEFSSLRGFPAFLYRHRLRVGALLGIVFGILLTVFSGEFIWQIEITGNELMTDGEVLTLLRDEGVYEGAYAKDIDALAVANRILQKSDLAFIGVNIVGNRVEAVVLEEKRGEEEKKDPAPSNVVAKKNGVIVSVILESGVSKLRAGQTVSQGELLISGVNELRNGGYHYQAARGQVFAETLNEITIRQSLIRYEKRYTGEIYEEKSIIFFNKSKKVTKGSGNFPLTCDRIETRERIMLFDKIPLPIWSVTVSYRAFTLDETVMTESEATRMLRRKIMTKLSTEPLISYREEVTLGEGEVVLKVTYRAIEDIAKECPLFDLP